MSFKVPEQYRITVGPMGSTADSHGNNGAFRIDRGRRQEALIAIASDGEGWEHVSVSVISNRIPTWGEMCIVKDLFWDSEDTVVQFHPPKSQYVDNAEVLHLWRKIGEDLQTPPTILVGIKK